MSDVVGETREGALRNEVPEVLVANMIEPLMP